MRDRLEAARPDVLLMLSNDHLLNWPINNIPDFTVGIGEEHVGPADWYDEWLALTKYRVPGHPALARHLVREGARRARLRVPARLEFDDGFSVPLHYLNPEMRIPLVPVSMNCTVPPIPTPERAYQGARIARLRARLPGGAGRRDRAPAASPTSRAARATSGWTRPSTAGSSTSSAGDHAALLRECTSSAWRPRARAAPPSSWPGSWSSLHRRPGRGAAYTPSVAWRTGTGMVVWSEIAG